VRRLVTWLAGTAGVLAAHRALTRRREPAPEPDMRVDELREKLAQARGAEEQAEQAAAEDPDARRRAVHEQARAAIDEMGPGEPT